MTTATDPARSLTASGLIQEAEPFRIAAEAEAAAWDSARETVWDSEGGHDARHTSSHSSVGASTGRLPIPAPGM
jgi:hypothetical protein